MIYLTESRFDKYPDTIREIKSDIRKVASLDTDVITYDDLMQIDFLAGRFFTDYINKCQLKNMSVEDCIDNLIKEMYAWLEWVKNELTEKAKHDEKVNNLIPTLTDFLSENYIILSEYRTENGHAWDIEAPTGSTHSDCIRFADSVAEAIDAHYDSTGRGGSWSQWWLRTSDGLRVDVGWKDHSDNWIVEIK